MKKRPYKLFIEDTIEAMNKIERYIKNLDYDSFAENTLVIDAVVRNLEVIGEAIKNVPNSVREKYPNIPWKRMIGLRNIVIHEYFGIDLANVWKIITQNIPEVEPHIMKIFDELKHKQKRGKKS
ncbi:MAG: DUF86 domain-containing protein [Candidatus Hydrothermarchaeota archaeon]|nr:DUF86 domain-containing protein [Candidatus Hydrothermarchaeota archaeon]